MFARKDVLPDKELPSAQEIRELGQGMAKDWRIGGCEFFKAHACNSEAQYKLRCMERGKIMQHAHMGFRNADKSFNAYADIYDRCLRRGVEIDRYGICLDWSMGYPAAQRESQLKGTGLILRGPEAFAELTSKAPVASHFGDFMLGFPGAMENTCYALAAGVTSIGNLGQYFTFQLPGWRDDVETTRSTLGAIALMAAQPETVLVHSNLDDGFAAVFEDLSTAVGAAILERYLVEDLMGGQIAHCYGHHYSTPDLRLAFHYALAEVSSTPGSMVYGNTTSYRGTAAENYASLAGYLSVDIAAQRVRPTGHAINPVPVTENERIPDIDEIVDAQLFSARMIEVTENHFQFAGDDVSDTAKTLVEGGELFFDNLLKGFAEAGIDIQNPVEMFLAIRRIGGKKLEAWYGPGKLESGRERRVPQVASDTVRELNTATERILKELEHYGLEKLVNNNLRIVVATTDVHEHSKMLLERLFSRIGIEVIDGGVSVDPRDLAQTAERNDAHAIALSTYNGVALTYYGMLRDELIEMGMGIPVLVGGQLNEIPQDSEDSLPVDVGDELEELGAVVCRTIPDAMPWLIELTEVHHEAGMKA